MILGSTGSGKNLLCSKYMYGFSKSYEKTLGVDIYIKDNPTPDGELTTIAFWMFSPDQQFDYYWDKFFRGASGVIILYDVTKQNGLDEAKFWIDLVHEHLGDLPIILLGNKVDLTDKRIIDNDTARIFAEENRISAHVEGSVKDDINILQSLDLLNDIIYYYRQSGENIFEPLKYKRYLQKKTDSLKFLVENH